MCPVSVVPVSCFLRVVVSSKRTKALVLPFLLLILTQTKPSIVLNDGRVGKRNPTACSHSQLSNTAADVVGRKEGSQLR